MVIFIFVASFGYVNTDNNTLQLEKEDSITTDYIKIKDNSDIFSQFIGMFRSAYARYDFDYSFQRVVVGEYRYFPGNDICIKTNPQMSSGAPYYIRQFEIDIEKKGWGGGYQGSKNIYANNGRQNLRWNGVGPGWYRVYLEKTYKQGNVINGYNSVIDNCSF